MTETCALISRIRKKETHKRLSENACDSNFGKVSSWQETVFVSEFIIPALSV
jgi:hypothetical protein